jgi:hypothetical protein
VVGVAYEFALARSLHRGSDAIELRPFQPYQRNVPAHPKSPYRYGDFPEPFWDARPDAPIDPDEPVVVARIIMRGSSDALHRLVSPSKLRAVLPALVVPDHVRAFWRRVLSKVPPG